MGCVRRNFLVPIPSFDSFDALNAHREGRCLGRMDARLRGHTETIGQRMERDLEALLPLTAVPHDACDRRPGPGQFPGPVPDQRLLGPVGLRPSPRTGKGLRGPGCHQLRLGDHRPAPAVLPAGRLRVRPHPLPAAAGAKDRRPGPGPTVAGMRSARGVREAAPAAGIPNGQAWQAGVRAGSGVAGDLFVSGSLGVNADREMNRNRRW